MLFGDRDPVAEPGTATGTPGNWWTVTAAVPDLFDHIAVGFAFYRDEKRVLDPDRIVELPSPGGFGPSTRGSNDAMAVVDHLNT